MRRAVAASALAVSTLVRRAQVLGSFMLGCLPLTAPATGLPAVSLGAAAASPQAAAPAAAPPSPRPWLDARRSADERAALALAAMTLDEKIALVHGAPSETDAIPGSTAPPLPPFAGYVPAIERLGLPALYETDASLGVVNPGGRRSGDVATALPSSLALASNFDPSLAFRAGALVGAEAHAKGFNVLLGGGMNLARDPRNGRNFEYLGEDPLLAGTLAGEAVRGTQEQHVISTVKHFVLNVNETNRTLLDARIDRSALRESDLLAFEIAVERGRPGAVMCSYNLLNGEYACANRWLLTDVLKQDWRYPGWVMSDWGAVHAPTDAAAGLDQESGGHADPQVYFDAPLRTALDAGTVSKARLDDMVLRILRSMFAVGIVDHPPVKVAIDYPEHAQLALEIARKGIVLLKNAGSLLPLNAAEPPTRIAVIGGHADRGVLSGGGSAQVTPFDAHAVPGAGVPPPGPLNLGGPLYDPSPPLAAIAAASPRSQVVYDSGAYPLRAARAAAQADVAVVFVTRHESEGADSPGMELPDGQDALIEAVAAANPHTVVVLETGNPVVMPWLDRVPAVVASWFPGELGGQAIADVLFGVVNPSGRLPVSFPRAEADLVRPELPNLGAEPDARVHVDYTEGADVGYRGYRSRGITPLFAFGFGLSFTRFEYGAVTVTGGATLHVEFTVRNVGDRPGADIPQVYLTSAGGRPLLRLLGFQRVELAPQESRRVELTADPRLLGSYDERKHAWVIDAGRYGARVGASAEDLRGGGEARVAGYSGPSPAGRR